MFANIAPCGRCSLSYLIVRTERLSRVVMEKCNFYNAFYKKHNLHYWHWMYICIVGSFKSCRLCIFLVRILRSYSHNVRQRCILLFFCRRKNMVTDFDAFREDVLSSCKCKEDLAPYMFGYLSSYSVHDMKVDLQHFLTYFKWFHRVYEELPFGFEVRHG